MSDYYVGMKHDTFLARNKDKIRDSKIVYFCKGGHVSKYRWSDGRIVVILWNTRHHQLRIMCFKE